MQEQGKSLVAEKDILPTPKRSRVLILGSRISGAHELAEGFQAFFEEEKIPSIDVNILHDATSISQAFLNQSESGTLDLPIGVILLPEMRQYDPGTGIGITLDSYTCGLAEDMERLCHEYGVPLVEIQRYDSSEQITGGLKEILVKNS